MIVLVFVSLLFNHKYASSQHFWSLECLNVLRIILFITLQFWLGFTGFWSQSPFLTIKWSQYVCLFRQYITVYCIIIYLRIQSSHRIENPVFKPFLLQVLNESSQRHVKRKANCLEPCLRQLSAALEGMNVRLLLPHLHQIQKI